MSVKPGTRARLRAACVKSLIHVSSFTCNLHVHTPRANSVRPLIYVGNFLPVPRDLRDAVLAQ
jgi:hypothetical protein